MMKQVFDNLNRDHRCAIKWVKILGKYYLKKLNDEEFEQCKKTNTGIVDDIKNDDELLEFMLKLKALHTEKSGSPLKFYYVPSLNDGKEAALVTCGHHAL